MATRGAVSKAKEAKPLASQQLPPNFGKAAAPKAGAAGRGVRGTGSSSRAGSRRGSPDATPLAGRAAGAPPPARIRRKIRVIGCPLDLGADRRGVDMGPSAIRMANLNEELRSLGHEVVDVGNLFTPERETKKFGEPALKFLPEIVSVTTQLAKKVEQSVTKGWFPLVLGGDHAIAMGTLAGLARAKKKIGMLYFDAHGDFNTDKTTPSGNIHGMPFAASLGFGDPRLTKLGGIRPKLKAENSVLIGVRSLDPGERELIRDSGITVYTMRDVDEKGMRKVMKEALDIATRGTNAMHVSFDMDVCDASYAPGTGTPVPGGLGFREAHLAMEHVAEEPTFSSLEVVEVNPLLDVRNVTGQLAVGLIASALGKSIL